MDRESFYERCARLLETVHDYRMPAPRKTRWNGREPGNGRFPGHGLIRHFGSIILVNLHTPPLLGYFGTEQAALDAIEQCIG